MQAVLGWVECEGFLSHVLPFRSQITPSYVSA